MLKGNLYVLQHALAALRDQAKVAGLKALISQALHICCMVQVKNTHLRSTSGTACQICCVGRLQQDSCGCELVPGMYVQTCYLARLGCQAVQLQAKFPRTCRGRSG